MSKAAEARELILLPSLKAQHGPNGGLVLTQKYLNGAAEYAKNWPGPVTTLVQLRDTPTSDMDHVEVIPGHGPTALELRPQTHDQLVSRLTSAAVALGFLSPQEAHLAPLCRTAGVPLVYTSEYSVSTEKQIIDAETRNPILRWRRKLWVSRAERFRIEALRIAAGIQCSGAPTYEIYRHINPNALLFFDNRVPEMDVMSEQALTTKLTALTQQQPLRLVFGGRLIAMKGALELPLVARELKRLGVPFTLDIYGKGDLEGELQQQIDRFQLQAQVKLKGVLDFHTGWIPLLKSEADVFVCCHLQGDPSSTYPEVMSCGVPIAGYDNEAFKGVVKYSGSGWLSPLKRPQALAKTIAQLHVNRPAIADAAMKAREFAVQHAFERTFRRRVDHLVASSRLIAEVKQHYSEGSQCPASLSASK